MGYLGISLIAASVVLFCLRPPAWFSGILRNVQRSRLGPPPQPPLIQEPKEDEVLDGVTTALDGAARQDEAIPLARQSNKADLDRLAMPPPPLRPAVFQKAEEDQSVVGLGSRPRIVADSAGDEQTTPKASAVLVDNDAVPRFALSGPEPSHSQASSSSSSSPGAAAAAKVKPPTPTAGLMVPPPWPTAAPPSLLRAPRQPGSSTLPPLPSAGPLPNRNPLAGGASSSLAPPPTHSSKPKKPSRQIALAPGHSPLDWARLSSNPAANLRGLPPNSPYLRVTPSMLRQMTGRKGKDAWTVLGGRVYNISPYLPFHPGGEPELLRGAGRDGTKMFGEIHPWVNYEGMLSACLVGIYVQEEEAAEIAAGKSSEQDMEAMD
ncbi:hypothetical protein B0H66DRAFT_186553 [Apodospora peruviana]|uniref:Cytochrome b5 heme-binding domain-containing protein n=1 Tax=Apodospora peruviana TaxID=516989 RepID=A0AAE0IBL8_9PEZI|nr:hypothetical protein B0H66DRAFT_186553 [Apodospora peruviana]